jgi:hypothetical protein
MKVNVTIDCTPEEARNFMGLPDLKPMQDRMMGEIEQRLRAGVESMNPESLVKTWLPASMQGIEQVQQIQHAFWQQLASIASVKSRPIPSRTTRRMSFAAPTAGRPAIRAAAAPRRMARACATI